MSYMKPPVVPAILRLSLATCSLMLLAVASAAAGSRMNLDDYLRSFSNITVKFYSDAACATPIGNTIALTPNTGDSIDLAAGTYSSTDLTNYALCSAYTNTTSGCHTEFYDTASVQFTYTYTSPVNTSESMCVPSSIQGASAECLGGSYCGFSAATTAYLPPPYTLFLGTNTVSSGDLKDLGSGSTGVGGADKICQSYAAGVYAGTYKAMIVDGVNRQACASGSGNCTSPSGNNIVCSSDCKQLNEVVMS